MGSRSSSKTSNTTNIKENNFQLADNSVGNGPRVNVGLTEGDFTGNVVLSDQGAIEAGAALGFGALDLAGKSVDSVGSIATGAIEKAYSSAGEQNKLFADELTDSLRYSDQMNAQNVDRALAIVSESNRSETAQAFNKLITYGGAGVVALGALYLLTRPGAQSKTAGGVLMAGAAFYVYQQTTKEAA
jgi:hypothetical protein